MLRRDIPKQPTDPVYLQAHSFAKTIQGFNGNFVYNDTTITYSILKIPEGPRTSFIVCFEAPEMQKIIIKSEQRLDGLTRGIMELDKRKPQ